jgi:chromosomal replication initiator protein
MGLEELWKRTLAEMELRIPRAAFVMWLKSSRLTGKSDDGTCEIGLPHTFAVEWVSDKYEKHLLGILRTMDASIRKLEFLVDSHMPEQKIESVPHVKVTNAEMETYEQKISLDFKVDPETGLNPKYNLNSFVVGPSNELAWSAASAIIKSVGRKYNPFFIYGGVGLGKTHLIQSIGNEIKTLYKGKIKPYYVTSEKYTSDVVWAMRNKRMDDIKRKYREVDVLIIDDIQFIGGKEKTEEEFFHTFNTLYEHNKQIIISSDRPPQSIPTLEERLRSRFEGGLIADVGFPEYEMRVAIVKSKLQEMNRELHNDIVDIVAKRVKKNIRELEGILTKILFYQESRNMQMTSKAVEDLIEKTAEHYARKITDDQILKSVAEFFHISVDDLITRGRKKEVVEPRQIAMYLLRDILDMSYPYIGEKLGRDHTTAIHAVEKIGQEINKNASLGQKINMIRDVIYRN